MSAMSVSAFFHGSKNPERRLGHTFSAGSGGRLAVWADRRARRLLEGL